MSNLTYSAKKNTPFVSSNAKNFLTQSSQTACVTSHVNTNDSTYYKQASHKPLNICIEWLLGIYSHRSNPAIKSKIDGEYRSLKRTISDDEFLELWRSPDQIIAIRFDTNTREIVIDIDSTSPYLDVASIQVIRYVLEDIGLAACVIHHSSDSGGIHLRYPLPEERSTYAIARTVEYALAKASIWLKDGQVEAFPNRKTWVERGKEFPKGRKHHELFDYKAIRLPCQVGYELLDDWLEPVGDNSLHEYRRRWEWCAEKQDMELLDEAIAHYSQPENRPQRPRKFGAIKDIQNDHDDLLAHGFLGNHETNEILGNLTRQTRILEPTTGERDLAEKVLTKVQAMPGYRKYCRHQHHIEKRCLDWARCCIKRGYYYHGDRQPTKTAKPKGLTNEEKQEQALKRFNDCLKTFISDGRKFPHKTELIAAILKAVGGSKSTIQKYWERLKQLAEQLLGKQPLESNQNKASEATTPKSTDPPLLSVCTLWDDAIEPERVSEFPLPTIYLHYQRLAEKHRLQTLTQVLPESLHFSQIPALLDLTACELRRSRFVPNVDSALDELNRCDVETIWLCLDFFKTLPTALEPFSEPLPISQTDYSLLDAQLLKQLKRQVRTKKWRSLLGRK